LWEILTFSRHVSFRSLTWSVVFNRGSAGSSSTPVIQTCSPHGEREVCGRLRGKPVQSCCYGDAKCETKSTRLQEGPVVHSSIIGHFPWIHGEINYQDSKRQGFDNFRLNCVLNYRQPVSACCVMPQSGPRLLLATQLFGPCSVDGQSSVRRTKSPNEERAVGCYVVMEIASYRIPLWCSKPLLIYSTVGYCASVCCLRVQGRGWCHVETGLHNPALS
ncbi:hypothetical protein XENOCAPTIV_000692, partial [Xenoophorus captivus]